MTLMDGCYNGYYEDTRVMITDIVTILQREVLALVANGCQHIIIDEPALLSYPERARDHGVQDIAIIFSACPDNVKKEIIVTPMESVSYQDIFESLANYGIYKSE